ncbi:MAG TPA: hypothetical protein VHW04_23080 [Solirubrobacteraceae bacterium]|jgi:hypothetical protein|nr:hypothetical protein [Solirubrobacteraceae bacterium]
MATEPYASAGACLGSGQRHDSSRTGRDRPLDGPLAQPRALHLPTHAAWLNQIEIYFSILARNALTACHFDRLDWLSERVLDFQAECATTATPFDWTFTCNDLHALLDRLDQHGRLAPAA